MSDEVYVTPPSYLPIIGSIAFLVLMLGVGNWLHGDSSAVIFIAMGFCLLIGMVVSWFAVVIEEGKSVYAEDKHNDRSFRIGMIWFIFTEIAFFLAFFGVLFYIRAWALPQLSGDVASKIMTHKLLWPNFSYSWPVMNNPDPLIVAPRAAMAAAGIPAINTLILLLSGVTITVSHHYLLKEKQKGALFWLIATIILGCTFLYMQGIEYGHAFSQGLTLSSGIYGNIFFMMTGFHGLHVMIGSVILVVVACRMNRGDFSKKAHFAFEASAWYWHFVDVVWLALFVFVYWI